MPIPHFKRRVLIMAALLSAALILNTTVATRVSADGCTSGGQNGSYTVYWSAGGSYGTYDWGGNGTTSASSTLFYMDVYVAAYQRNDGVGDWVFQHSSLGYKYNSTAVGTQTAHSPYPIGGGLKYRADATTTWLYLDYQHGYIIWLGPGNTCPVSYMYN